ncbi:MAG: glyoxalase superfamily protein [Thermoplasmata archaeon]
MNEVETKGKDVATRVWVSAVSVTDFDRALEFYRDVLGFPVQLEARDFGWMELGPEEPLCKIGLSLSEEPKDGVTPTGMVLEVEDMDAFAKRLRAHGVKFTQEPVKRPWGGVVADFLDPDGNEIEAVYHPGHYD